MYNLHSGKIIDYWKEHEHNKAQQNFNRFFFHWHWHNMVIKRLLSRLAFLVKPMGPSKLIKRFLSHFYVFKSSRSMRHFECIWLITGCVRTEFLFVANSNTSRSLLPASIQRAVVCARKISRVALLQTTHCVQISEIEIKTVWNRGNGCHGDVTCYYLCALICLPCTYMRMCQRLSKSHFLRRGGRRIALTRANFCTSSE